MSSRPRRFAAQKAVKAITDMADRDDDKVSTRRTMSSRSRNTDTKARGTVTASVSRTGGPTLSPTRGGSGQHMHLTVKAPASKLRQAISGSSANNDKSSVTVKGRGLVREESDEIIASGRRNTRGVGKKSYVVESDSEEEEEEEEEEPEDEVAEADEITVGSAKADDDDDDDEEEEEEEEEEEGENDDLADDDADGEVEEVDEMDVDADGDLDMDLDAAPPPAPTIRVSRQPKGTTKVKIATPPKKSAMKKAGSTPQKNKPTVTLNDDDDDDELSELDSDMDMDDTVNVGGEEDAEGEDEDMDAEGDDVEVADDDGLGDSDDDESRAETPDVSRMTARQRAKHGAAQTEYMKLSDEVQVKKHFTAEELSMRRAEMARRRRNLSEKRNEEVKMETINKLLKKQAPKTTKKAAMAGDETPDGEESKANPVFVRWVSNKNGVVVAVPDEILGGPAGRVFTGGAGMQSGKMVEEVS